MTPAVGLLLAGCVLASVWLTGRVRRYALKHALLDLPNQRGSHTVPTPRGGGVGFVVTTIAGLLWWTPLTGLPSPPVVVLAAAVAVAGIGFVDDHGHVSPIARLLAQFAAGTVGILALARADAGGLAGLAYVRLPLRRLWPRLPALAVPDRLLALAYVPIIRVTGDVAKMLGYPGGVLWRLGRRG